MRRSGSWVPAIAGAPYADASGANVDTVVLVFRVTMPSYVTPQRFDFAFDHDHDFDDFGHDFFDRD